MKTKRHPLVIAAMLSMTGGAQAAGFALYEHSANGLGMAFAGQAAAAEDASTIFFNPGGLTRVQGRQAVGTLTYIHPSAEFSGEAISTIPEQFYVPPEGNGGDTGVSALVPAGFYAMDISSGLKFGLGIYAPFGLSTEYDYPWAGMTQALKSEVKTINVNPTLAWKVSDRVSLGVGVNWQYIEAELSSYKPLIPPPSPSIKGVIATMTGDDSSWGWNIGALFTPDDATRIGISYRSRIKHELTGDVAPSGDPIVAEITLPDMASISLFRQLNPQWDLLADATWTGWSGFDKLEVLHAVAGVPIQSTPEQWEDVWRFSLGLQYRASDKWTWRAGLAYDQTPIPDAKHRTPRIPDADRISVALGAQYRMSTQARVDVGYMHLFFADASIDHCEPEACAPGVKLTGTYDDSHAGILGAQITYDF